MLNPYLRTVSIRPTDRAYNTDGSLNYGGRGGKLSNGFYNVVALQNLNYIQSQTTRAFGNFQADYKILKNLTYKFVFAPEYVDIMEDKYLTPLHG